MVTSHAISVEVDFDDRRMTGTDELTLKEGSSGRLTLYIREGSRFDSVSSNYRKLPHTVEKAPERDALRAEIDLPEGTRTLTVEFSGTFDTVESVRSRIRRGVAFIDDGVVGPEGALFLSDSVWYPTGEGGVTNFTLRVTAPAEYTPVAEGKILGREEDPEAGTASTRFRTVAPVDGLNLVLAPFVVTRRDHKGVELYTYFFEDDPELTKTYLDKTEGYLDLYTEMFGPYPFTKFAVVENFLPTGYGMPSFTLLGSGVLRLPFIPDTSLGHEIAHNWWGNSVYIDPEGGNWVEALTTFVSDYRFAREESYDKALEFRLRNLRGYKNFAKDSDLALRDFTDASSPPSRAVGYNKGFMVFNMLERLVGPDAFTEGLRGLYKEKAFERASWADLRRHFEEASEMELGWFFDQWVKRPGGPRLELTGVEKTRESDGWAVSFEVAQGGDDPGYRLLLPVVVETAEGKVTTDAVTGPEESRVAVRTPSEPTALEVDPSYQAFRILSDAELPPSLGACFGDKSGMVVTPGRNRFREKYFDAADLIATDYGLSTTTDEGIGMKGYLTEGTLFIFGSPGENRLADLLEKTLSEGVRSGPRGITVAGETYPREGTVAVVAVKNPRNPSATICVFTGNASENRIKEAARRMRFFGQKSYLVFTEEGGKPASGTLTGDNSLTMELDGAGAQGGADDKTPE